MPSNYDPKDGDIIFGPFANDRSLHNAVLLHIVEGVVYLFPISSREQTMNYYLCTDSAAVVQLSEEEIKDIFRSGAKEISFIYCGKRNIITKSKVELLAMVENGQAKVRRARASEGLIERIVFGVMNSRTNDQDLVDRILGKRTDNYKNS